MENEQKTNEPLDRKHFNRIRNQVNNIKRKAMRELEADNASKA